MKPQTSCSNHPDSEGLFQCRYCGKDYCELCCQSEPGFYRCDHPSCVKAYQEEREGPQISCPECGRDNPQTFPICFSCGANLSNPSSHIPDSLVTIAKFRNANEANLARTKLLSEGIESFVADEDLGALYAGAVFLGGFRLQTLEANASQAKEILSDTTAALESVGACRYCGAIVREAEMDPTSDILHCQKPGCLEAYQDEVKSLAKFCPHCGNQLGPSEAACPSCGKKLKKSPTDLEILELSQFEKDPKGAWPFSQALLFWFFLELLWHIPVCLYGSISYGKGTLPDGNWMHGLYALDDLTCVFIVWYWVKRFKAFSWREGLGFLGFKSPNPGQLAAGAIILVPFFIFEFLALRGYQQEGDLLQWQSDWPGRLETIFIGAGLFEEVIYRGFLFRLLRQNRSFPHAAILSSALWTLSHLSRFIPYYGPVQTDLDYVPWLIKIFAQGILAAYLFEKGGNNIWGWMLFHVFYDSPLLIDNSGSDFYVSARPENYRFVGDWLLFIAGFPIIRWLLPDKGKAAKDEPEGETKISQVPAAILFPRWKPFFLSFIAVSGAALIVFLVLAPGYSQKAENNAWQKHIDAHPRYSDAYRQWAYDLRDLKLGQEAEGKCQKALEIDPKNYKAWLLWGKILNDRGLYDEAAAKFQKAVEVKPRSAAAYLWWGHVLEKSKHREEALDKYNEVRFLHPDESYFLDYANQRISRIHAPIIRWEQL